MSRPKHYAPNAFQGTWKLTVKRNKIELVNTKTGQRGTSYCHPDDTFDMQTGFANALIRACTPFKLDEMYSIHALALNTTSGAPGITLVGSDGNVYEFVARTVTKYKNGKPVEQVQYIRK